MASSMSVVDCPECQSPTRVLESRRADGGGAVRRRRECPRCARRFTTFERREPEPVYVIKRSGERQRFDRKKLRAALLRAAHKRPVSPDDVETIVERVEATALEGDGELPAERIGELSLDGLMDLDLGAYLQFAGTLEEPASAISSPGESSGADSPSSSVRLQRKDSELPAKAASRRGLDE
jgi:transcriptional repressor NrdR